MNFVDELKWRGMIHDVMPGTEEQLKKEMTIGYIGFDPTSDSLGIGNLVQVMILLHFQKSGHKPIALVGGATGMVGDPSGKSEERNLLNEDILQHNLASQKKQLEKFLDFDCGKNSAEIVNNYDWYKGFEVLQFARNIGKHITVNYMMAKDSVKNRISGENHEGMSFTEFMYQMFQAYDFYWLWKNKNVKMQMGGSDQWGNIVTGTELIRRKDGGEAFALTAPLVKKADGTKFGKTESGNIWLDPKKTSPYKFYQFWMNSSDADAASYIRIFTLLNKEEIESVEKQHLKAPHLRTLQKALAKDVTIRVHSEADYIAATDISEIFFGKGGTIENLQNIAGRGDFLRTMEEVGFPACSISFDEIQKGVTILELLASKTSIFTSKGEARKMIQGGGVSMNMKKVEDANMLVGKENLLNNSYILIQKGKKNFTWLYTIQP